MPKNKKRTSSKHNGDDSSSDSDNDEENVVLNPKEYNKLLQQLFPSDYMSNKIHRAFLVFWHVEYCSLYV